MHFSTTAILAFTFASIASADLHYSGLCVDRVGGQNVYNDAATKAACGNYLMRNTGSKQWDTCPDCVMQNKGGVDFCHSEAQHIGGDELNYYCKLNGAADSLAD
ncbi:hypothetical protein K458DRAFT_363962 [Lentithecium fluviatile CBS 122367]|uniref:Uncharacterized protein n=1 Tax=Lentithecium fluviatile CBS 122367 TaxID=1168545 RepID=A0A6G1J7U5_9PLEO|nr:hypothetical protein K458DRAFT_363962 [Lentithecium fluviatile CBS 122367]